MSAGLLLPVCEMASNDRSMMQNTIAQPVGIAEWNHDLRYRQRGKESRGSPIELERLFIVARGGNTDDRWVAIAYAIETVSCRARKPWHSTICDINEELTSVRVCIDRSQLSFEDQVCR